MKPESKKTTFRQDTIFDKHPVFDAIKNDDLEKIQSLLSLEPELIHFKNVRNETPYAYALRINKYYCAEIVAPSKTIQEEMRDNIIDRTEHSKILLLHTSVRLNKPQYIPHIINKYGVHFNNYNKTGRDKNGDTALHCAVTAEEKTFNTMLKYTLNINVKNNLGNTPLHLAALYNHPDKIEKLINREADIYLKNNKNETALDLARERNNTEVMDCLIKKINSDLEVSLTRYLEMQKQNTKHKQLFTFSFFGFHFNQKQKVAAANTLLNKIQNKSDANQDITPHISALNNGRLKEIYKLYLTTQSNHCAMKHKR